MPDFRELIRLISNGDPVDAGTTNRPLRDLDGNIRYLRELFEAASLGEAVFARNRTLSEDTAVGMAVYYNASEDRFEPGLAGATVDADTGEMVTSLASQIWGVVHSKANSTRGDILLHGFAALDISGVVSGAVTAGVYYLSGTTPGHLVTSRPPMGIPVLQADGAGNVNVKTQLSDLQLEHKHYKFSLVCLPAGDHEPPVLFGRHEITNADSSQEGWLPADDPVFAGQAPDGAVFGYNLSQASFANLWPPLPLGGVYLEWDRGEAEYLLGMGVPLGSDGLCVIDRHGIWWMSDCYGDVPWPTIYDSSLVSSESSSSSSSLSAECPREMTMRMALYFTKPQFYTSSTVVTSLRVAEGSEDVLTITCVGGGSGATGDLEIAASLGISQSGEARAGHLVVKELDGTVLKRGPVVEALVAGSDNVILAGTAGDADGRQGTVTISVVSTLTGFELPAEYIRLNGATEEAYEDTLAIGLPAGRNTSYRDKFTVPRQLDGVATLAVVLRLRLLARAAGDLPPLTVSYRRLPYAATPTALPTSDTNLTLDLAAATGMSTDEYIDVETSAMTLQPGDDVLVTVARDGAGGDGFAGEVHVLGRRFVVTEIVAS